MRPGPYLVARPGCGVLVVALGTLVVPFNSTVNFAFPYITRAFGLPIPAIQWVVYRLYVDLRRADAGIRPRR